MDTSLTFLMVISAFETALIVVMWMYIFEFKMRTAERINKLEGELYEATVNSHLGYHVKPAMTSEEYDRQVYRQKVSQLLDMALVKS